MLAITRRAIVGGAVAAIAAGPKISFAQAPAGPFKLDPLPYPNNALEPHIDAKTMEIHHGRHHAAYVNNLNGVAKDHPMIGTTPLHDLLAKLNDVPEAVRTTVRNNAGGHANHMMFWQIMGPAERGPADNAQVAGGRGGPPAGGPQGELAEAINRDLGGLDKASTDFNAAGGRVFGSGWVFVTVTREGKLAIETKPNQDTPLMDGKRVLLGNDVWEHAYYLTYQNRRPDYLKAWWNVVNWRKVGERYAAAKAGTLTI